MGLDGIQARLLKDASSILKISITFLINFYISKGMEPDDLKMAEVKLSPYLRNTTRL